METNLILELLATAAVIGIIFATFVGIYKLTDYIKVRKLERLYDQIDERAGHAIVQTKIELRNEISDAQRKARDDHLYNAQSISEWIQQVRDYRKACDKVLDELTARVDAKVCVRKKVPDAQKEVLSLIGKLAREVGELKSEIIKLEKGLKINTKLPTGAHASKVEPLPYFWGDRS